MQKCDNAENARDVSLVCVNKQISKYVYVNPEMRDADCVEMRDCTEDLSECRRYLYHRGTRGTPYCVLHLTGSYQFLTVPINSHRVRIGSPCILIYSPLQSYCVVLDRVAIVLDPISSCQFLLIRTYHRNASLQFCLEVEPTRIWYMCILMSKYRHYSQVMSFFMIRIDSPNYSHRWD